MISGIFLNSGILESWGRERSELPELKGLQAHGALGLMGLH